jgi:hypothetical protein
MPKEKNNGHKSSNATGAVPENTGSPFDTYSQPLFESDLITAGRSILEAIPRAVFHDDKELIDTCRYLGWLVMMNKDGKMNTRIQLALYKISGTMAIGGRARDDAIQAHVGVYFPRNASKEDKQVLEKMQNKNKRDDERQEQRAE